MHDKYPLAKHHILVLPKNHIKDAKAVMPKDAQLSKTYNGN